MNPDDSCPDTSQPDVSPDGCSSWQRDSDDDGVVDFLDECAKTPDNEFSNQVGCSESQLQSDVESEDSGKASGMQWVVIGGGVLFVAILLGGFLLLRRKPLENFTRAESVTEHVFPEYATRGVMKSDGKEWIEFPTGSGHLFYRDPSSGQWVKHE